MSKARRVAVIMAGGSGERFWPLSRQLRPKQLLKLTSPDMTLLEESVRRIEPLIPIDDIFISTSAVLANPIAEAGMVARENVLAEPCRRNTAGCLCWVASELQARFPSEEVTLAILTADHLIQDPDRFRDCVEHAMSTAESHDALVTIGVKPDRAETGYGYIEFGNERTAEGALPVERFREKPNHEQATDFLAAGNFYWNSGMFFWRISVFESELKSASPDHAEVMNKVSAAIVAGDRPAAAAAFELMESISIDFALMERARRVLMIPATFPWDDVGSWDALERSRIGDGSGNVAEGNPVLVDTENSIVVNESPDQIAVGVVGVDNLIVIVTDDAVLVVSKDRAQEVRQIPRELKKRNASQI